MKSAFTLSKVAAMDFAHKSPVIWLLGFNKEPSDCFLKIIVVGQGRKQRDQ